MSGKTSTTVKERWNSNNYTQVKISVKPETATVFKATCLANHTSMTAAITSFMNKYSNASNQKGGYSPDLSTRRQRKTAIQNIIYLLERVRDNEEQYMVNIPANLQGANAYSTAEECLSVLNDTLDLLSSAY